MTRTAIIATAAALTMLTAATASACMRPPRIPVTPGQPSATTQPSQQGTLVQTSTKCRRFERYWICE